MAEAIEKTPTANQSVNQPASGTYGEGAALDRLKASLPAMDPAVPTNAGPAPMPPPQAVLPQSGGRPTNAPMGIPGVVLGGGAAPGPANTPVAPAPNPQAARLTLLEGLATSQDVSETTRQWAQAVLEALRGP